MAPIHGGDRPPKATEAIDIRGSGRGRAPGVRRTRRREAKRRGGTTSSTAPPLSVFVLGPLRVFVGDREIPASAWKSLKAQQVFKYLLARDVGEPVPNDAIVEAIWPARSPVRSELSLRAAMSALRHTLEPDLPSHHPSSYVSSHRGRCALFLGDGGRFDVTEFTNAFTGAVECAYAGDGAGMTEACRTGLTLYRGEFLKDEPYADWAESRRERLRKMYVNLLIGLGSWELECGDSTQATDLVLRVLEVEPASERAYRLIISSYARAGQWSRVRAFYDRYCRTVQEYGFSGPVRLEALLPSGFTAARAS